jgi:hypothetical protein
VPKGLIHDWIGAVFMPSAPLEICSSLFTIMTGIASCRNEVKFSMAWQTRSFLSGAAMMGWYHAYDVT